MTKLTCAVPWSVPRLVFSGTRRPNSLCTYMTTSSARPMRRISLKESFDRIGAVLQLAIVRRRLVHVRVEQAAAQRHVVELRRKVGLDQRDDFVEIEQAQVRIGLGACSGSTPRARRRKPAPRSSSPRARSGARRRRARRCAPSDSMTGRLLREQPALESRRDRRTRAARAFAALTASVWLSEMFTIRLSRAPGGIEARRGAPDPAVLVAAVRRGRVPERHRREVRERRLVVADAVHDRDLAVVVEVLHPLQRLVPAELRVDRQDVGFLDADRRPMAVVERVAVGTMVLRPSLPPNHSKTTRILPVGFAATLRLACASTRGTGPMPPASPRPRPPAPSCSRSRRETPLASRAAVPRHTARGPRIRPASVCIAVAAERG